MAVYGDGKVDICRSVTCGKQLDKNNAYQIYHPFFGGGSVCGECFIPKASLSDRERYRCDACHTYVLEDQFVYYNKRAICMVCCIFGDNHFCGEGSPNTVISLFMDIQWNGVHNMHQQLLDHFDAEIKRLIFQFENARKVESDPKRNAVFQRLRNIMASDVEETGYVSRITIYVIINRMNEEEIANVYDALQLSKKEFMKVYRHNTYEAEKRISHIKPELSDDEEKE
jgi:hypothetical protein